MQRYLWLKALAIPLFLQSACTHTQTEELATNCNWESDGNEPDWLFLKCQVSNQSNRALSVAFKPVLDENEDDLTEPTKEELASLEKRLRIRAKAPTAPMIMNGDSSGRPELFMMQALTGLGMMALKTGRAPGNFTDGRELELNAGKSATIVFPLYGSLPSEPKSVRLHFTKPQDKVRTIELKPDPQDFRRRPQLQGD